MDCLLIFPPGWEPYQPYLSLPYLKSELDYYCISNLCIDTNILFYEYLTSVRFLNENTNLNTKDISIIVEAKNALRSSLFYNKRKRNNAFQNIDKYFSLVSSIYPILNINSSRIQITPELTDELITNLLSNKDSLPFYPFYEYLFSEQDINFKLIGISLTSVDQIIPTIILLKYLRFKFPASHLMLGGNIARRLGATLIKSPITNQLFDSISNENNANSIIDFLKSPNNLSSVRGITYLEKNDVVHIGCSPTSFTSNIPNFDDFPLNLYWSPKLVLPIQLSFGCYWGKCSFCEEKDNPFKQKQIAFLIKEIENHIRCYKTNLFSFVDDSISISQIYKLNQFLEKKKINISWRGMIRAKDITIKDSSTIKKSGGELIMLGIESGSQNVLEHLNKGISVNDAEACIRNLSNLDIWNHCFFMFKTENETFIDAKKTLTFLINNKKYINSFAISTYIKCLKNVDSTNEKESWILHKKDDFSQINKLEEDIFYSELRQIFSKYYIDYKLWLSLPINHLFILKLKN